MKTISLNLSEEVLEESRKAATVLRLSRAAYIRKAIEHMNREIAVRRRAEKMVEASKKCRAESMRVNAEFAAFETDPDA
jgi:hypothetical protein